MTEETRIIYLGARNQYETIVSACDYDELMKWKWSFKISAYSHKRKVYARRHRRIDGRRITVLLHQLVLEELMGEPRPSELHTPDHEDRDSLNNARGNLRWATKREQIMNRDKPLKRRPVTVADIEQAIIR